MLPIRKSWQRRNYLLLEVVIAMALVALVAPVVMKCCYRSVERKETLKREMRAARNAELCFGRIKQMLYEGSISWHALREGRVVKGSLPAYSAEYTIEIVKKKYKRPSKKQPSMTWRLLRVSLTLHGEPPFDYLVMVQRIAPRKTP